MKDNFSTGSNQYARYRPTYPSAFFTYLQSILKGTENAWDCATGNGQIALPLAQFFKQVYATDISQSQLDNAAQRPNINYSKQPAEKTHFENNFFDLVIVGQAVHWFDFELFYAEVKRTARKGALLVVVGYSNVRINPLLDKIIFKLYETILGAYWDGERKYIDEGYQTIPFPFEEIKAPPFSNTYQWTLEHLVGYLNTWSAVKHYIHKKAHNPVYLIYEDLKAAWGNEKTKVVHFPLLLRIGKVHIGNRF